MISTHATQRAISRALDAGLKPQVLLGAAEAARLLCEPTGSIAARLACLPKQVGQPWGERSNGDEVWAIIRNGRVVTMMLRRSTQPSTAEAMRVDKVVTV